MQPDLDRRLGTPARPGPVGAHERVLRAVLCGIGVATQYHQAGLPNTIEGEAIQEVEVLVGARDQASKPLPVRPDTREGPPLHIYPMHGEHRSLWGPR